MTKKCSIFHWDFMKQTNRKLHLIAQCKVEDKLSIYTDLPPQLAHPGSSMHDTAQIDFCRVPLFQSIHGLVLHGNIMTCA